MPDRLALRRQVEKRPVQGARRPDRATDFRGAGIDDVDHLLVEEHGARLTEVFERGPAGEPLLEFGQTDWAQLVEFVEQGDIQVARQGDHAKPPVDLELECLPGPREHDTDRSEQLAARPRCRGLPLRPDVAPPRRIANEIPQLLALFGTFDVAQECHLARRQMQPVDAVGRRPGTPPSQPGAVQERGQIRKVAGMRAVIEILVRHVAGVLAREIFRRSAQPPMQAGEGRVRIHEGDRSPQSLGGALDRRPRLAGKGRQDANEAVCAIHARQRAVIQTKQPTRREAPRQKRCDRLLLARRQPRPGAHRGDEIEGWEIRTGTEGSQILIVQCQIGKTARSRQGRREARVRRVEIGADPGNVLVAGGVNAQGKPLPIGQLACRAQRGSLKTGHRHAKANDVGTQRMMIGMLPGLIGDIANVGHRARTPRINSENKPCQCRETSDQSSRWTALGSLGTVLDGLARAASAEAGARGPTVPSSARKARPR
jgi:hypothetical protein